MTKQQEALVALEEGLHEHERLSVHLAVVCDHIAELEEDLESTKYQLVELRGDVARSSELARAVGELLHDLGKLPLPAEVLFRLRMAYTAAGAIPPRVLT
jgi:hypothetical protein